jgi:hypothetical protein
MLLAACGDDPFLVRWEENVLEALIYSIDREPYDFPRPSAFNMLERRTVILEDPSAQGRWDFAVERQGGSMVLLPPPVLGVTSLAAIAPIPQTSLESVTMAPADTMVYVTQEAVPLEMGTVYVIRTHRQPGFFGRTCQFYGKIEPVEIDAVGGTFRFRHDVNPDCNNRSLIPPDS